MAQEVRGAAVETAGAAHDLWEFWYYGEHIRCIKPRTLLNFLLSAGAQTVKVTEVCEGLGATFELIGPVDESGEPSLLVCRLDRGWRRVSLLIGLALVAGVLAASPAWAVETRNGDRIEVGSGEVVNDDLYAFGDTVRVDGMVKGDLVAAGSRVIVDGTVEGDLISAAQAVEVNGTVEDDVRIAGQVLVLGEDARINDDLFAGGYSLESKAGSAVGGSLFYGGNQSLLAGTIEEDLKAGLNALELRGEVGGDVNAGVGEAGGGAPQFLPGSPVSIPSVQPGLALTDSARIGGSGQCCPWAQGLSSTSC